MRYLLLFLFGLLGLQASAQYSISGRVINADGEPLMQASVFVIEQQIATITDDDGYYSLTDLEAGEHTLKASYVGYKSYVDYVELDADLTVNINLGDNKLYLNTVDISTNRVAKDGVFTQTTMSAADVQKDNVGQDIPYLLRWTPSVVATSDAGTGIGYTGLRIRGSDATRVNVTINGVPINDAESQAVFWVNMPDLATSVDGLQVVRGVGASTNGAGAFGGTVSMTTDKVHQNSYIQANGTLGSFGTSRASVSLGTGLINNQFYIDGRYSVVNSNGFIDRATADLSSYYLAVGRITEKSALKFITFSGSERTYQAWNGVPEGLVTGDEEEINDHYQRNVGSLYFTPEDSINYFEGGRSYNYYQYRNQVDDYTQSHYQLHHLLSVNQNLTLKTTAYYTKGRGFFEQFKFGEDYGDYDIPIANEDGDTILTGDTLIRRKWLDNDLLGALFTAKYKTDNTTLQFGLAASRYDGGHFGRVEYAQGFTRTDLNRRYYENDGVKDDISAYLRYEQAFGKWNIFTDAQVRKVDYTIKGERDDGVDVDFERNFTFFNPKVGVAYNPGPEHNLYASFAVANREPDRNDIIGSAARQAKSERLNNVEIGYRYSGAKWNLEWNNYLMSYDDQLVLTGALDDVGNSLRVNVDDSYRLGTEISATTELYKSIFWNVNTTLSQNRISNFEETILSYDGGPDEVNQYENTNIAFSPSVIVGNAFLYKPSNVVEVELSTKYVGAQYLDNTSNDERKLDPFTYTNLRVSYDWDLPAIEGVKFTLQVNNLFDTKYSTNGYTYSYKFGEVITENFLYPQAGIHFMLGAQMRL